MPDMMFQALDPTGLNETAEQVRAMVQEAKSDIEAELDSLDYAQPDGIYPEMTVGAVIGADETSQWATRESTGSGAATVRSVQGATVVWNQLFNLYRNTETLNDVSFHANDDGSWTVNGTATRNTYFSFGLSAISSLMPDNHKFLAIGCPSNGSAQTFAFQDASNDQFREYGEGTIFTKTLTVNPSLFVASGYEAINLTFWPQIFDLTQMFGSGNEPATVAEFERMYPEAYYPYSAPTLKPVRIAGIESTDANGDALDGVEWETQTLRAAGSVRDELMADELVTRVGVADASTAWVVEPNSPINSNGLGYALFVIGGTAGAFIADLSSNVHTSTSLFSSATEREFACTGATIFYRFPTTAPYTAADAIADMRASNAECFYPLATPTTTPISPALPMTYRVKQGGTESIVVPEGEISAAPLLTIAEGVNMGTELARIWAAIEALQSNRGSALGSVRIDSDVSSTEVKEAPTMDEKQTTERESEV